MQIHSCNTPVKVARLLTLDDIMEKEGVYVARDHYRDHKFLVVRNDIGESVLLHLHNNALNKTSSAWGKGVTFTELTDARVCMEIK